MQQQGRVRQPPPPLVQLLPRKDAAEQQGNNRCCINATCCCFGSVCCTCRSISADVLIDDNVGYALDCANAGIQVLLYDWEESYPWSKLPEG